MVTQNIYSIRVAGFNFEIRTCNPDMDRFWSGYSADGQPDCIITTTPDDIEYEKEQLQLLPEEEKTKYFGLSDMYYESLAVHKKISDFISQRQGAMFHGALIEKDGRGYLFAAKSGTGKTTHIRNWQKVFDDVTVVNGDKPILRLTEDGIYGYGTPWCGKERLNSNTSVKLENLIILERSEENSIERANYKDYMNQLFTQIYIPKDSEGMGRAFEMIHHLSQHVRLYRLGCNMDPQSAVTAYEGMKE